MTVVNDATNLNKTLNIMIKKKIYTAQAQAKGGREGKVRSDDGVLDLKMEMPKEMGGKGGKATNPEQLFAAGYAACFESTIHAMARREKIALSDSGVEALITIGVAEDHGYEIAAHLIVSLPNLDTATAEKLIGLAHQNCPYSKATWGNIHVEIQLDEKGHNQASAESMTA